MADLVVPPPLYADVVVGTPLAIDIASGLPGPPGPTGPPGLVRVNHGTDPDLPRPTSPVVLWVGSVEPANADQAVDLIAWTS